MSWLLAVNHEVALQKSFAVCLEQVVRRPGMLEVYRHECVYADHLVSRPLLRQACQCTYLDLHDDAAQQKGGLGHERTVGKVVLADQSSIGAWIRIVAALGAERPWFSSATRQTTWPRYPPDPPR